MQLLIYNIFVLLLISVAPDSVLIVSLWGCGIIHQYYKLRLTNNSNRRQRRLVEMIISCTEIARRKYSNRCETYMSISSMTTMIRGNIIKNSYNSALILHLRLQNTGVHHWPHPRFHNHLCRLPAYVSHGCGHG
jgi:hypothetical protein